MILTSFLFHREIRIQVYISHFSHRMPKHFRETLDAQTLFTVYIVQTEIEVIACNVRVVSPSLKMGNAWLLHQQVIF